MKEKVTIYKRIKSIKLERPRKSVIDNILNYSKMFKVERLEFNANA